MNFVIILSLFNIILVINGEYGSYNQYSEYDRNHYRDHEIPSLKSLFNLTTFRDKTNKSSPCLHHDKKRDVYCEPVSFFDAEGYEKSLQETRNLILSRLNLDTEPDIRVTENTLSFLDQLENKILNDDKDSIIKTKYDVKSPQNKVFNSMHEASSISSKCTKSKYLDRDTSRLCISFQIPIKNLLSNNGVQRKASSVVLWLYVRTASSYDSNIDDNFHLEISNNHKHSSSVIINNLNDGWNTINLTSMFKVPTQSELSKDSLIEYTLMLKCFHDCSIDSTNHDITNDFYDDSVNILINNYPGKKPLLSISIEEIDEMEKKRNKRRANPYNSNGPNFRVAGLEGQTHTKYCSKNYQEKDRECCLNRYFVDFNRLKWSHWIVSPNGYTANYCSGKCNDLRSFNYGYGNINSEFKIKYNEKLKTKDYFDANEMLETCCHPISMESLVITYMANNGSLVRAVIPNMIITGCGCS